MHHLSGGLQMDNTVHPYLLNNTWLALKVKVPSAF